MKSNEDNQNNKLLSERIKSVPKSFIREILKVTNQPDIISFAGGLPNADLFPVVELAQACNKVFENNAAKALQYASTEGDYALREWIAKRYQTQQGLTISAENILICNGSQQAFDLIAKVLLNKGDDIVIENPGYLGAIQSFSLYQPKMHTVAIDEEGMIIEELESVMKNHHPKLVYTVPNFQNPTGISYTEENRQAVANIISRHNALLIQDDPYGELRFEGEAKPGFYSYLPEQTILLGTFSKVVVPSFRLGWIVAPEWLMEPLIVAKQAADLHTNYFSQQVLMQYLQDNSLDQHLESIVAFYARQKKVMLRAIEDYFPDGVHISKSEGGMFLWLTLPAHISSMKLLDEALIAKVAFVPGNPFYVDKIEQNTLRLSFVTVDEQKITEGIKRLGECISKML
jgi:2-aminoadipate transaminase